MKYLPFLLLFLPLLLPAQTLRNVLFRQEGNLVVVSYDLIADPGDRFDVQLYLSSDRGKTWPENPLTDVSGHVGQGQAGGNGKKIIWTPSPDARQNPIPQACFKIKATVHLVENILPEVVLVRGGTFSMGSHGPEKDEQPVHTVHISDFYLGEHEVTVYEFSVFVSETGHKTDAEKGGPCFVYNNNRWIEKYNIDWRYDEQGKRRDTAMLNCPVLYVSWNDAQAYCEWLSSKTGQRWRLPTEAEWEYAAGNGMWHTVYSWGNEKYAKQPGGNIAYRTRPKTDRPGDQDDGYARAAPVGSFPPNELGLYDMSGNVWEWCNDFYLQDYYTSSAADNPQGPRAGDDRVFRGGGWNTRLEDMRITNRGSGLPVLASNEVGFRVARDYP